MDNVQTRSAYIFGFFSTVLFWVLVVGILLIVPIKKTITPEKKITTIHISLASPTQKTAPSQALPQMTTSEQAAIPQARAEPQPTQQKAAAQPKTAVPPKKTEQPKAQAKTQAASTSQPAEQSSVKTTAPSINTETVPIGSALSEAKPAQKPQTEWPDSSAFSVQKSLSAPEEGTGSVLTPTFEGIAGSTVTVQDSGSSTSASRKVNEGAQTSSSTTSALNLIAKTYSEPGATAGVVHQTSQFLADTNNPDSVVIKMSDGSARKLLNPKEPKIILSPEAEALIDSSKTVTIRLRVLATGTVSPNNISFTPSGLLPVQVQLEIKAIIARWQFEPAATDGQASFQYSIKEE